MKKELRSSDPTRAGWRARAGLLASVVLGAVGTFILSDRPGLTVEYFAIEPNWRGAPVDRDVGPPGLESRRAASYRLLSHELFSIRWRGWIRIPGDGTYRFTIATDERAYLELDGERIVALGGGEDGRQTLRQPLESGLHQIEFGLSQTGGPARLTVSWSPPGTDSGAALPPDALFARRPSGPRLAVRSALSPLPLPLRRLLGVGLLVLGMIWLSALFRSATRRVDLARRTELLRRRLDSPALRAGALVVTLGVVAWVLYRFTARTVDGDDVRYLDTAFFGRKLGWILNRYSHVHFLRFFVWIEGDAFAAGRLYWSLLCAGTVGSLAVAASSLAPGRQLRTLSVTLFLFFSQVTVWGTIGAVFADYTAMLFVTAGVAAYLFGRAREATLLREWPTFWIGLTTVLAWRAKETGLILLWLVPLLLWAAGRIDPLRFIRRMAWWLTGAAAAFFGLMLLDGLLLGDLWFSVRRGTLAELQQMNFADLAQFGRSTGSWMDVLWQYPIKGRPHDLALRHLSLLVVLAAFVAAAKRRPMDRCLLHLIPIAFVAFLVTAHVRATFVHSPRHLLPILPIACLLAAALFHDLGLDEIEWREILRPRALTTLAAAGALVWIVVAPYRIGELQASTLVPGTALSKLGWSPESFVETTLGPLLVLFLLTALVLSMRVPKALLLVSVACLPFLFGTGFELTRLSLARGGAVQKSDLILYPYDAFRDEIAAAGNRNLYLSTELFRRYGMGGQRINRDRIASVYFHRDGLVVHEIAEPDSKARLLIASRRELERWRKDFPDFQPEVTPDPSGELVLIN